MSDAATCVECGRESVSADGTWKSGEVCLLGNLFACSETCAKAWATKNAAPGYRPGEPGFFMDVTL